jgi:hypothetical protein
MSFRKILLLQSSGRTGGNAAVVVRIIEEALRVADILGGRLSGYERSINAYHKI